MRVSNFRFSLLFVILVGKECGIHTLFEGSANHVIKMKICTLQAISNKTNFCGNQPTSCLPSQRDVASARPGQTRPFPSFSRSDEGMVPSRTFHFHHLLEGAGTDEAAWRRWWRFFSSRRFVVSFFQRKQNKYQSNRKS